MPRSLQVLHLLFFFIDLLKLGMKAPLLNASGASVVANSLLAELAVHLNKLLAETQATTATTAIQQPTHC